MATLGTLAVNLTANSGQLVRGIQQAETAISKFGNAQKQIGKGEQVRELSSAVDSATVAYGNIYGAATTATNEVNRGNRILKVGATGWRILAAAIGRTGGMLKTISAPLVGLATTFAKMTGVVNVVFMRLTGLGMAARMVGKAFSFLLIPVRAFVGAIKMVGGVVLAIAGPFIKVWFAIQGFRLQLKAAGYALQLMKKLLGMLPPKLRVLAIGLIGVGAAASVAKKVIPGFGLALKGVAAVAGVVAGAARTAGLSIGLLAAPLVMIRNPAKGAAMAFSSLAGLTLQMGGVMRSAVGAVGRLASKIGMRLVKAAKAAGAQMRKLGAGVKSFALRAAKSLAMIGVVGVGWGIKLAADAESAKVAFTTLLGSADKATKVLGELQEFSASTPFALGDLRDASKLLLNAGTDTDQLLGKMTMLGDIAAGTGKPIGDFARIYSKVGSTGKLNLETLNQLAERGVPIYDALAKQMGVNRSEMLKMISKGKVGFSDLDGALQLMTKNGGRFAGGMKKQSQTLAGIWSTLKDNVGFAFQAMAEMIIKAFNFKGLMTGAIALAQGVKGAVGMIAPVFQTIGAIAGAIFGQLATYATTYFGVLFGGFGGVGEQTITFRDRVQAVVDAFVAFGAKAVEAINNLTPYVTAVATAVGGFVRVLVEGVGTFVSTVGPPMVEVFSAVAGFIGDAVSMIGGWVSGLAQAAAQMMVFGDVSNQVGQAFGSLGAAVSTVTNFIKDAFVVVQNAIARAITWAVGVGTVAFENFADIAKFTANSIALFFVSSFENMKHFFLVILPAAANWFWENIGALFTAGVNFAMSVFTGLTTNIKNAWNALWAWINGDSDTFDFKWESLTKNFEHEVKKLPEVADREMTALEKELSKNAEKSSKAIGESYRKNVTEPLAELDKMQNEAGLPSIGPAPEIKEGPKIKQPEVVAKVVDAPTVDEPKIDKKKDTGPSADEIEKQVLKNAKDEKKAGDRRADGGTAGSVKAAETIMKASKQTPMVSQQKITNKTLAKIQLLMAKQREQAALQGAVT